jgi:hypothetical protein
MIRRLLSSVDAVDAVAELPHRTIRMEAESWLRRGPRWLRMR